jgi:hypothetical protein
MVMIGHALGDVNAAGSAGSFNLAEPEKFRISGDRQPQRRNCRHRRIHGEQRRQRLGNDLVPFFASRL